MKREPSDHGNSHNLGGRSMGGQDKALCKCPPTKRQPLNKVVVLIE